MRTFNVSICFAFLLFSLEVFCGNTTEFCGVFKRNSDYFNQGFNFYFYPENTTTSFIFNISDLEFVSRISQSNNSLNSMGEIVKEIYKHVGDHVCFKNIVLNEETMSVEFKETTKMYVDGRYPTTDYLAKYCELFIDKYVPFYNFKYYGRTSGINRISPRIYIKIKPERLDGAVVAVRFYGRINNKSYIETIEASPWMGSKDYFEFNLFPTYLDARDFRMDGAFYVETDKNTRYWTNTDGQPYKNFVIDDILSSDIAEKTMLYGCKLKSDYTYSWSCGYKDVDVGNVKSTADACQYLNPFGCR